MPDFRGKILRQKPKTREIEDPTKRTDSKMAFLSRPTKRQPPWAPEHHPFSMTWQSGVPAFRNVPNGEARNAFGTRSERTPSRVPVMSVRHKLEAQA